MEFTSAILMVLGIYVGLPIVLTCAIGGVYALGRRLARTPRRMEAARHDTIAEASEEKLVEAAALWEPQA